LADSERCQNFVGLWELGHDKAAGRAERADAELPKALAQGTNSRSICEATVYAKYGKRFDDDRLNRYFYGAAGFQVDEWPYGFMRPNPDFDPSWLGPDDTATLELIRTLPERALAAAIKEEPITPTPTKSTAIPATAPAGCSTVGMRRKDASHDGLPLYATAVAVLALLLKRRGRSQSPRRPRATCRSRLGR
jgi:hypothetical protein